MERLISFFVSIPVAIFGGIVVFCLWGWFVVPLHVPAIGIAHAIGLSITAKVMAGTLKVDLENDDDLSDTLVKYGLSVLIGVLLLVMGYVIHLFM